MPKPIAVVTGASKGIGRAVALRLAKDYDIVALARSNDELQSLAQEIEASGAKRPAIIEADLYNPETPGRLATITPERPSLRQL